MKKTTLLIILTQYYVAYTTFDVPHLDHLSPVDNVVIISAALESIMIFNGSSLVKAELGS